MWIRHLMLLVALAGADMGLLAAGTRAGPDLPLAGLAVLTVALLATAIVGAILRRGRERATWLGIAAFGWSLLLVGLMGGLRMNSVILAGGLVAVQVFALIGGAVARAMAPLGE